MSLFRYGKDDSENIQVQTFGETSVFDYEIPYHTDLMESLAGIDLEAARRVSRKWFLLFSRRYCKITFQHSFLC